MSENKQPKPRITSWIRQRFGEEILAEIISGKRKISLNGTKLKASDKNFRDKRVTATSVVVITPEPVVLYQDTSSKIIETLTPVDKIKSFEKEYRKIKPQTKDELPSQERIDLFKKYSGVDKETENEIAVQRQHENEEPAPKIFIKDFLSADDIKAVTSGKARVFADGIVTKLDREISVDHDTNPIINGNIVEIKVTPQFQSG